ncbi:MAG: hypothetical protein Q4E59_05060 [Bacteroidales bacterium]|nr:hypothetical protein [Bacteroidales bacterium]
MKNVNPTAPKRKYTPEDIAAERAALTAQIKAKEKTIRQKWTTLTAPPTSDNKFQLWTNRAAAAYTLYDGFMTGYKLLRTFNTVGRLFRKRGKKLKKT